MSQSVTIQSKWTEKIRSDSRVLDPLGLGYHLNIQRDFVPGITSVTRRMRYYTMQAWFFKNMGPKDDPKKLERLFILSTLNHHNGDYNHPSIRNIFNKEKFKNDWNEKNSFSLESKDFRISGFGRTYYVNQLQIFRCAWFDYRVITTPINDKLADTITINPKPLEGSHINKSELNSHSKMCICDSETNQKEIEIFSKILFGFIKYAEPEDLNDDELELYKDGNLNLDFIGVQDIPASQYHLEQNMRRRNSLFLYMKIIDEVKPEKRRLSECIWDAVYFTQNTLTKEKINFQRLEKIRKYWETHQYLIYYVYAIESILDILQLVLRENVHGVKKSSIIETLNIKEILETIKQETSLQNPTLKNIQEKILQLNHNKSSDLNSIINESRLFDDIRLSDTNEKALAYCILLLVLLRIRFDSINQEILRQAVVSDKTDIIFDSLNIYNFVNDFDQNQNVPVIDYIKKILDQVINKHLYESAKRYRQKTKNWIFFEEDGYLYPSGRRIVEIKDRNNRWDSIFSLLKDTKMIEDNDSITLTSKGKSWLKMTK